MLHKTENEDLNCVLNKWSPQHHNEHMPFNDMLILKQAKPCRDKLRLKGIVFVQEADFGERAQI